MHVFAVRTTLGQPDYFAALALQQHGEQSALRERKGRVDFVIRWFFLFFSWED